ncbi:MAG: UvrB/UvrC motif-containing protein [Clostridia bacterium]|nr:UvrB/UvrC motif-containing protein [Clostridia bacterium]MBQ7121171.1 UvrB/UvrC motif-containing protein [Clostridia bacterium]
MLCQNCGKNEATTHIKQIINGDMAESHLCSECASHLGYSDMFSGFGLNLSELFGGFLGDTKPSVSSGKSPRCPKCGSSFDEIVHSGKVGCADCYRTFYDRLLPSIQRIHGKIKHSGKTAAVASAQPKVETTAEKIEKLKSAMNDAVAKQDFENAAKIRDEIKALEGGEGNE